MISLKKTSFYFYFGTLVSSIGSMTLAVSLIAFMLKAGFSLLEVGVVVGLSRFLPLVVSVFIGHHMETLSPRKAVLWTELGAGLSSVLLLVGWVSLNKNFPLILAAMILRTLFTSLQTGSRSQISKLLSDESYQSNSKNAVWLNKVTQGATLFGGGLSFIAIQFLSLPVVIVFDAITFIINGVILLSLPIDEAGQPRKAREPVLKKFRDLYKFNARAASLDGFLALSAMGTSALTARLAGASESWIALFVLSYGLSVWVAGYLERIQFIQNRRALIWLVLAASFLLLGLLPGPGVSVWVACLIKDTCFWILFHRISAHIQMDTPKEIIPSVTFARNAQLITILAMGEIIVGLWKESVPLPAECALRAGVALAVAVAVSIRTGQVRTHEKAHL